jgi:N-carbamoyl-L-amino-acid hydrolase
VTAAQRAIAALRELAVLTSNAGGAQRTAWSATWRIARAWFADQASALGLPVETDAAGNNWITSAGQTPRPVIVGSHLDSVPNGGWLDGALGMMAALEALRAHAAAPGRSTLCVVDWADEEGRFGMSLFGSSAAAGRLDMDAARRAIDREGQTLESALAENGLALGRVSDAAAALRRRAASAYLELHIEQGPVLAAMNHPVGVVTGTCGIERHIVTFTGQAAHAGSTPIPMRRDAFLAAAAFALECRRLAANQSSYAVATVGAVQVAPNIPTAVPGSCTVSIDMRSLDQEVLSVLLNGARDASAAAGREHRVGVQWSPLWAIEPRAFDAGLIRMAEEVVRSATGEAPKLPSGPVHDASEMAGLMPAVMLFACSPNGLSHCREEDTPEPQLEIAIQAFLALVARVVARG